MDPPGHTVFLYLRELKRSELQKQAKLYGIRANQKSEVLRQRLQEVLTAPNSARNSPQFVAVVNNDQQKTNAPTEEKQKESALENNNNKNNDVQNSLNKFEKQEGMIMENENQGVEKEKNDIRGDTESEESKNVPPQVVIIDLDSDEMVDLANESIVSPTTTAKEKRFPSNIPTPTSRGTSVTRKVFGERTLNSQSNCKPSKLGKPRPNRPFQLNKTGSVANIIRNKNSPLCRDAPSRVTRKPVLITKTIPRPKQMPLSRRNEMQYQKFLERQIRGRKNRQEEIKRAEFASFVR